MIFKNLEVYMHPRLCIHEHFDLITKHKMWNLPSFLYTSISKNCGECKMQSMSNGFNNIQSN
jgi:hypothetical protein